MDTDDSSAIVRASVEPISLGRFERSPIDQIWSLVADDACIFCSVTYGEDQGPEHNAVLLNLREAQVTEAYCSPTDKFSPGDSAWRRIAIRRRQLGLPGFISAPRDHGMTSLAVVRSVDGRRSVVYGATLSAAGCRLLECASDTCRILPPVDERLLGVLDLVATPDWLIASALPGSPAPLYATRDPSSGWTAVLPANFDDERNEAVTSMAVVHDRLYCGTLNSTYGYQVWSVALDHVLEPDAWSPVLAGAAERFTLYEEAARIIGFRDALYIAASATPPGELPDQCEAHGAELLRMDAEQHWEVLCGGPRFSPQGLKVPVFCGEGCGDVENNAISALCVHRDRLYIGTEGSRGSQLWCTDGNHLFPVLSSGWSQTEGDRITAMTSTGDQLLLAICGEHGVALARCNVT